VLLYVVAGLFIICHFHFMFVMVINREVSGHVAYMEVHKINVKKFVRNLQGRRPLRSTRHRGDGNTAGRLHTVPV
jgi:hypothetical protein